MSLPPDRNQPQQWGLASDLANGHPSAPTAGDSQQPPSRRPPFRIGRSAGGRPASESTYSESTYSILHAPQPPPPPSSQGQSNDPALLPYGLVSELTRGLPTVIPNPSPNPISVYPPSSAPQYPGMIPARAPGAKRALSLGHQRVDPGPYSQPPPPHQQPWGPPSFAGGSVMPDQEPDYGIVSELKGHLTSPPSVHHNDLYGMEMGGDPSMADTSAVMGGAGGGGVGGRGAFGLEAEVARRRGAAQLPPNGRFGGSGIAPLRTRKRLAPAGPLADFGLSQELADRQAQDPFTRANHDTNQDPFIMAGEKIKFPGMPQPIPDLQPHPDQELVEGGVLLKVPGGGHGDIMPSGAGTAAGVINDGMQYGIAEDLGAEEALRRLHEAQGQPPMSEEEARRQRKQQLEELLQWEPPGHKYVYNEETGMIHTNEGGEGAHGGRVAKEFIEDGATGHFYRLNQPGVWRRIKGIFTRDRREEERPMPSSAGEEEEISGLSSALRVTLFHVSNFFSMLGIFVQGLLAGFALLNFCLIYITYGSNQAQFLSYYSPLAMFFSRVYFTLITLAVIASVSRYCRDEIRRFQPSRLFLRWIDGFQILFYSLAYIFTVLCTPLDDELTYEYNRDNFFYKLSFNSSFTKRLNAFQSFNLIRTACCGLGWLLFCYQHSPAVFDATVDYETKQRKTDSDLRLVAPMEDPSMVLANLSPSPARMRRRTTFSPSPSPH